MKVFPAHLIPIALLAFLFAAPAAHSGASTPARKAAPRASSVQAPPAIIGGVWPQLTVNGRFDPKAIKNPVVIVRWVVDTKGRTKDVSLHPTSGSKAIDHALVGYVRGLRFTPGTRAGKPVDWPMSREFDLSAGA